MDLGRPPLARFASGDVRLSEQPILQEDLEYAVSQVRAGCRRADARGIMPLCALLCAACAALVLTRRWAWPA